jgi:hypothetical protein
MKNDSVVQVWCKRTTLATICKWYIDGGITIRSKSELVRLALEKLESSLIENGFQSFDSVQDATAFLVAAGIDIGPRADYNLLKNLKVDTSIFNEDISLRKAEGDGTFSKEALEEAVRKFQETLKGAKDEKKD